ncbi:DUF2948 family protein [Falsirhodobacter sp. alg1]|uniref:DUF2948 family protein n=1 Tax=Falsirhodobacter sp. alg1 TaxID=1472418 RepID=UPI0007892692|nr:DUF2948 family protein [Falsirhodobacter sp. alg1]
MADARFEDGEDRPIYLGAEDADDLGVISSLVQDAILPIEEMKYRVAKRQFALLVNRFRWEDAAISERGRKPERVRSLLVFGGVLGVRSQGINKDDKDIILSILSLRWVPETDGAGTLEIIFAGDGIISLRVEAIDATLRDVTRPYLAPSRQIPRHDD